MDALGAQLDSREIPTFAVEGTGSYGAGLARSLAAAGVSVFECERPRRHERRRGKSDLIELPLPARRLLAGERFSLPREGGRRARARHFYPRILAIPTDVQLVQARTVASADHR